MTTQNSLNLQQIHKLDYLNILLMLISFVIAYISPWPLLLGAYAILGPAHYLTEISWLHDRNYFTQQKADYIYLLILTFYMLVFTKFYIPIMILTLSFTVAMTLFKTYKEKVLIIFAGLIIAALTTKNTAYVIILLFLPTLIHVYVFTAGFILNGAIKNHSVPGYATFALLILCGICFFLPQPFIIQPITAHFVLHNANYFQNMVDLFIKTFRLENNNQHIIQTIRFIAFAYSYHYLNWVSKTGIIRWHEISGKRLRILTYIYLFSISLYLYNYGLGFVVLLSLSFLHVILELPLDVLMFKNIFQIKN